MNFQFKHRHTVCPPELAASVEEKLTRFERLLPEHSYVEIEVNELAHAHTHGDKRAEVIVDIPGEKPVIRFEAKGETFLEAIDRVLDRLDTALGQRKHKIHDRSYNGQHPKEWLAEQANGSIQRQ